VAAQEFENVYVVDSRNLSTGHGHIVCEAVKLAEAGTYTPQEIVEKLKALTGRVEASFLLDRLDYMRKGGRCSAVVALGANLLHLKPCIEVVNGKMQVGKKYRGSFETCILNYVRDRLEGRKPMPPLPRSSRPKPDVPCPVTVAPAPLEFCFLEKPDLLLHFLCARMGAFFRPYDGIFYKIIQNIGWALVHLGKYLYN
jgi:hypothetical protein